ncbi:MAG: hypothetical protein O3A18_05420 [Planctomycetota bacterium]|jgi:hypothetical protein|nr:hypothetical protein [Planctomycetota bacterium]
MPGLHARIFVTAVMALGATLAGAVEPRPSWECLPDDTALLVRLPQVSAWLEPLRENSRFGELMLKPDRLEGIWQLIIERSQQTEDSAADGWADWEESLHRYGLEPDDLAAAFQGEVGAGLVVRRRDEGRPPLRMLLAWGEPGEDVATRMLTAVKQQLEESAAKQQLAARRIDLELAGHEVVSAITPVMGIDPTELGQVELTVGPDAGIQAQLEALQAKIEEADPVQTGQTYSFHTVIGGRFIIATTLPDSVVGQGGAEAADFDADGSEELAREVFATFLAAHADDREAPLAQPLREPALVAAKPGGIPVIEILFRPRLLMADDGDAEVMDQWARWGLDAIGAVAWRQAVDGDCWRSAVALTLPAPRRGLLAFLDQPCDPSEVPSFVTREAVDFTQISLDLGSAFTTVRAALLENEDAEQLANMFAVADVQSQTFLGGDVATVLSGLGSRHWILSFPPRIAAAVAQARGGDPAAASTDSMAIVWQVVDEEPIGKLLGRLAPLTGTELQEEQGFQGLRLPGGLAAYVGRGHLVLALGDGTVEKILAAIRNPPAGNVSWRESPALRRARELVDLAPARMFGVGDASLTGGTLGLLRELVDALEPDDLEDGYRDLVEAGRRLLPSAAELEGMFGVGATAVRMTDDGMILENAWELPPR